MKGMKSINHEYTFEITCPHCGDEKMDSWEAGESGKDWCDVCENDYTFEREVSVTYTTKKA